MIIDLEQQLESNMCILEEINVLPLTLDKPLYYNYPAMKLGRMDLIDYFSHPLSNMAIELLKNDQKLNGQMNNWVITTPPYYRIPAAANLLARKTHQILQQQGFRISLVEPRLSQQLDEIKNQEDFKRYHDYSKNDLQERIAERERVKQKLHSNELIPHFKDHSVIIINDINVTGTQQHFMQQEFDQLQARKCYWLYIFNVDNTLAQRHPEIEYQLNNSQICDLDSYIEILNDKKTQHTARCVSRFFNEDIDNFTCLVSALNDISRNKIYQLALQEGRYSGSFFEEKMNLLARYQQHSISSHLANTAEV